MINIGTLFNKIYELIFDDHEITNLENEINKGENNMTKIVEENNTDENITNKNNTTEDLKLESGLKNLVKIIPINTDIGTAYVLEIADIKIRSYLNENEARSVQKFMKHVIKQVIKKLNS